MEIEGETERGWGWHSFIYIHPRLISGPSTRPELDKMVHPQPVPEKSHTPFQSADRPRSHSMLDRDAVHRHADQTRRNRIASGVT